MNKRSFARIMPVFVLALILFSNTSHAQKLYLKGGVGYAIGTHKSFFKVQVENSYLYQDTAYEHTAVSLERMSFGQGLNFEIGIGSFLGKNISVELSGFYLLSQRQTIKYTDNLSIIDFFNIQVTRETILKGRMGGLKPKLVLWGNGDKIRPYMKLGAIIGFGKLEEESSQILYNPLPGYPRREDVKSTFQYKTQLNLGYSAAVGFEVYMGEKTKFFVECAYNGINYVPVSGEYTSYTYMDKDILESLSISERNYEYVDEYNSTENDSDNTPTKQLRYPFSFSNIGLQIGLTFTLVN